MNAQRVDWFRLLADLKRCGVTLERAAKLIGVSHTTVQRWGQGSEPRHGDGEKLIALWMERTCRDREALPMANIFGPV